MAWFWSVVIGKCILEWMTSEFFDKFWTKFYAKIFGVFFKQSLEIDLFICTIIGLFVVAANSKVNYPNIYFIIIKLIVVSFFWNVFVMHLRILIYCIQIEISKRLHKAKFRDWSNEKSRIVNKLPKLWQLLITGFCNFVNSHWILS